MYSLGGTLISRSRPRVRYELRFEIVLTWLASFTFHVLSDSELLKALAVSSSWRSRCSVRFADTLKVFAQMLQVGNV